jgi:hypothetical protein
MVVVKYDPSGNVLWSSSPAGGTAHDFGMGCSTDANGNITVVGSFASASITFGNITLTNGTSGYADVMIVRYNPSGNVLSAQSVGGTYIDYGIDCATDPSGDVIITGAFESSSLAFGSITVTNAMSGYYDMFIAKLDVVASVEEITKNDWVNVYPNPSSGVFKLESSMFSVENAEVYDVLGNLLLQKTLNSKQGTLNLSGVNSGVYFLTLKTEQGIIKKKLILQK